MLNGVSLLVNSCFKDIIGRGFYIALWPTTKNGSTTLIPSTENHRECLDMPPRRWLDRIFTVPRLCSAFGETSSVWWIMSCWNGVKLSQRIAIARNWCVWAEHWWRNGHSTKRDTTKLSSSWKGRSYPTRRTLQTLLLPSTICFDRWDTAWLISISALMKKSINGSICGSPQKTYYFSRWYPKIARKMGKSSD